jgi:hypothetical protein
MLNNYLQNWVRKEDYSFPILYAYRGIHGNKSHTYPTVFMYTEGGLRQCFGYLGNEWFNLPVKTRPTAILSTTNPAWTDMGLNPGH